MTPDSAASSWSLSQQDGVWRLEETYTEQVPDPGGGGGSTTFPDIWSLDISTVTEPIETFIVFRLTISAQEMQWWAAFKAGKEPGSTTFPEGWPANSSNVAVGKLFERFNRGELDYLAPRVVIKHQKVYSVPPDFGAVGTATDDIQGCPFTFNAGSADFAVNFLFTGATCVQEGGNYRVTMEWLTSRPGKWDSYIYGP
jgi:hypothetical protein